MLAFKRPSGLRVIELLQRRLPLDQLKTLTVMLGMTSAAFLAATSLFYDNRMVSVTSANPHSDFSVTVEALECSFADYELVTRCTVTGPGERGVSTR
jgi:hypothetical protein